MEELFIEKVYELLTYDGFEITDDEIIQAESFIVSASILSVDIKEKQVQLSITYDYSDHTEELKSTDTFIVLREIGTPAEAAQAISKELGRLQLAFNNTCTNFDVYFGALNTGPEAAVELHEMTYGLVKKRRASDQFYNHYEVASSVDLDRNLKCCCSMLYNITSKRLYTFTSIEFDGDEVEDLDEGIPYSDALMTHGDVLDRLIGNLVRLTERGNDMADRRAADERDAGRDDEDDWREDR